MKFEELINYDNVWQNPRRGKKNKNQFRWSSVLSTISGRHWEFGNMSSMDKGNHCA
jgi:hypothetical protein